MNVLLWHVHGSWTTAFVQGPHTYLVPVAPDRGPDGRGRARTWDWPPSVVEVPADRLIDSEVDVVVLQRRHELEDLVPRWTGRRPGRELPAIYLEHNTPEGPAATTRHPVADHRGVVLVHVTWFNRIMWDHGPARTTVIEHGIVDPGHRYTGEVPAAAAVVNDPLRRGRVTGTDLVERARSVVPVDLYGMGSEPLGGVDLPQAALHREMARRRVYFHPNRWTSLGLSLIEAMHLGLPVVALATTEAAEAVPDEAGVVSNRLPLLDRALRRFVADPGEAAVVGARGRKLALERFGLDRFLTDWDLVLEEVTA